MVAPLVYMFSYYRWTDWHWDPSIFKVLEGAFIQSVFSTIFTLFFGTIGAFGLLAQKKKLSFHSFRVLIFLTLLPCLFPSLFVILLTCRAVGFLPMGLSGVVIFHCLMNVGLAAILLFKVIDAKAPFFYHLSVVSGVPTFKFIIRGLFPEIRSDFLTLGFYFMILYFFSFSIPLLVGGPHFGGVEVFIYEKIILLGQWNEALHYSILLFLLLYGLSLFVGPVDSSHPPFHGKNKHLMLSNHSYLSHIGLIPTYLLLLGLIRSLLGGGLGNFFFDWGDSVRGTLVMGLLTGVLVFVLLSAVSFSFLNKKFSRLLLILMNPGWVVVGFSFVLMGGRGSSLGFFKACVALSILYLPFLFRISFQQKLQDLVEQVKVSTLFPVSWFKIYKEVIWPQSLPLICFLSGLAALWACGDFALTGLVVNSHLVSTLALDVQAMINNYRLEQALTLLLPLLIVSSVVFFIFQGLSYATSRKILS